MWSYFNALLARISDMPKRNIVIGAAGTLVLLYIAGTIMRASAVFLGGVAVGAVGMKCVSAICSRKEKSLTKLDGDE